jgi:tetratricopeptide (TPR) repeat protein
VAAYFEQHTQSGHLPEAYYYVGRANSDLQNGEKALLYFQKALLEDSVHVTTRLKSRIYAQLGYIYLRNGLFEDAIGMQQLAHFYCEQIGDTLGMRYSNEDIQTITKLSHQVTVSEIPKAELAMKVQKLNAQVKSHLLQEKNKRLQKEKKKERTVVWIAIASSMLIAATFVWRRKKTATSISTNETQAPRTKRQFYDKEIDELLTTHITHNKVLKDADWKKIEERLSAAFPSFKERLFSLYQLSDTEYRICMLIKMEVAPSNIAKLMALGNSAVSQNRLRMQQKVFDGQGTAKDWDKFILSL